MLWSNPIGTDGFEFVEYATLDPMATGKVLETIGFTAVAKHRHKKVILYRQGEINFIVNAQPNSFAQRFAHLHGPSVCAIAFRVQNAEIAYRQALERGAWGVDSSSGHMELNIPAIKGVGDSLIYLVDRWKGKENASGQIDNISIYDVDFEPLPNVPLYPVGVGLTQIDHLTHNVYRGHLQILADFYESVFNFREIRYFDIEGKLTGLKSKAMTSPCGKIRIPINEESANTPGQIQEYLDAYQGEGIQHIALSSENLINSVDQLRAKGIQLLDTPDTYYDLLEQRIPGHGENVNELRKRKILLDGKPQDLLLQIFSANQLGPIFFEFIQRKGNEGFGEGNFQALFNAMELDQIRRGVLKEENQG